LSLGTMQIWLVKDSSRGIIYSIYLMLFKHKYYMEDHWLVVEEECLGYRPLV
jgi:hypothetical protein